MKTCSDYLKRVINGDKDALHCAFVWDDTPQGHRYWESQYLGEIPLDINALKSMLRDEDTPTLWRDMTDAEKGALLLAHHEEYGSVEFWNVSYWETLKGLGWLDDYAYRIKPEPKKVETVVLYGSARKGNNSNWGFSTVDFRPADTHRITLTYRYGKIDPVAQAEEL